MLYFPIKFQRNTKILLFPDTSLFYNMQERYSQYYIRRIKCSFKRQYIWIIEVRNRYSCSLLLFSDLEIVNFVRFPIKNFWWNSNIGNGNEKSISLNNKESSTLKFISKTWATICLMDLLQLKGGLIINVIRGIKNSMYKFNGW